MSGMEDDMVVVKLKDGENVLESLRKKVSVHRVRSGLILSGIGMLREVTLGYFKGDGEYETIDRADPVELTSMQGNIAETEKETVFHIHVTAATDEGDVIGGHLISAVANVVNEIVILKLNRIRLDRALNRETGLLELSISERSQP